MGIYEVPRARLARAIAHGENLARIWNEIPEGRLFTPKVLVDPNGFGVFLATNIGGIPDELPLLLGEMLYQLRSALDACIYQGSIYATGQNPPPKEGSLEFPITANPDEWQQLRERRLFAIPAPFRDALERIQPYNAAHLPPEQLIKSVGRSLGILHDLARKDRHRKLHLVGSWPLYAKPIFTLPEGVSVVSLQIMPPSVLTEGALIARFRVIGDRGGDLGHMNPQLRVTFGCAEPDLPPQCDPSDTFEHRIAEMVNSVAGVIDSFERNL